MLSDAEIALMRGQQEQALPQTMVITRTTTAPNGAGGQTKTEEELGPYPCRLGPLKGKEDVEADKIREISSAVVSYESSIEIQATDRLTIDGVAYEVIHIEEDRDWKTAGRAMLKRRGT